MKRLLITIFTITVLLTISFATLSANVTTKSVKFKTTNKSDWAETRMTSISGLITTSREVRVTVRVQMSDGSWGSTQTKEELNHSKNLFYTPDVFVKATSDTKNKESYHTGRVFDGFDRFTFNSTLYRAHTGSVTVTNPRAPSKK